MRSELDCLECIAKQTLRAARSATADTATQRKIFDTVARQLPGMDLGISPATLSMAAYHETVAISGVADPFYAAKRAQNQLALGIEDELRELVRKSDDPLDTALHIAAAGNVIDLGTLQAHEIDPHAVLYEVLEQRFAVDHTHRLRNSLMLCQDLLFLLDNAGEIVFDKILIEVLLEYTPVTAVVKGGPIINDALMEDAEEVGLTRVCPVIDNGGPFIGSPLDLIPPHFLARMRQADVIIGKGQGNYETVDDFDGDVFLILRAKCEIVARHMGVRYGQVGLISTRERQGAPRA